MKLDPKTDLTFTRTLKAPRALLWECWTNLSTLRIFLFPSHMALTRVKLIFA